MGRSSGFLARQFHAACQNSALFFRKKLVALGLALPMLSLTPSFAVSPQAPLTPEMEPLTTYSNIVSDFNQRFSKAGPHSQIVFIDRDDIARRMAQMPRGVTRDVALQKAVQDYMLDRTGKLMPEPSARAIADGIKSGNGQALQILLPKKNSTESICVVTGQNPDLSGKEYQQNIMGLYKGLYDDFRNRPMLRQMSAEMGAKFTDYHEMGHCMDRYYLANFLNDPDVRHNLNKEINLTHKAEAFGEIFAVLMLARDGEADMAGIRADQRLISIATNGYILAQRSGWEDLSKYIGFVYALHEGLWEAQREIDRLGADKIRAMSPQEIADLAYQITERDGMNAEGADHAVTFLLDNKFSLAIWDDMRKEFPHIEIRYQIALQARTHIEQAFTRVFGADAFDSSRPIYEQLARNIKPYTSHKGDADQLRAATSRLVSLLRQNIGPHDNPEMQIILNAAREKEGLRLKLEDASLPETAREQAMMDLALMSDAMRLAIMTLRGERVYAPSMDNYVRRMVPLKLQSVQISPS